MDHSHSSRDRAIKHLQAMILRRGSPRLEMLFYLILTCLTGYLTSVALHAAGLKSMAIRFPVSIVLSYVAFLFLLSFVVSYHRFRRSRNPFSFDCVNTIDIPPLPNTFSGSTSVASKPRHGSSGVAFDVGDGIAPLIVAALITIAVGSAAIAGGFILWKAPVLFAEVLVDGVLLFRMSRNFARQHSFRWVAGVVRRTAVPLIAVAFCYALTGFLLEAVVPGATSIGHAWTLVRSH